MFYALINPEHGEAPAYRLIADPDEAAPGEAVVEHEPGEGEVWDAGAGALRSKSAGEELAALKAEKRAEMEAAFSAECEASFPSVWVGLVVMAAAPQDARVAALRARAAKLQTRLAAVDAAAAVEATGAVAW